MSTSSSSSSSPTSLSTASSSSSSSSSFFSTSNTLTTTTTTTSTTSSQSNFIGFSSSTFFPFSPPPTTTTSTPSPFSQISTPHPSQFTNAALSPSLPLVPSSQPAAPTPGGSNRDAQATSDTGTTWTPGEIALIAVCSFIILLAILACGLVIFVRRRLAKKEIDRQFDFHMPSADRSSNPRRGSVGSVEKYGHGDINGPEGVEKRCHKGAPAYLAGLGGVARHKRSLSTETQAEAETSGTASLLMRKVRPASSRHSRAAVYGDEESRRSLHADQDRSATPPLTSNGAYEGREMHEEHAEESEPDTPREPSPPSSPSLPLLASASSPALNASFSRHTVPAPPSAWRSAQIEAMIPPVPLSPPPPSPDQQKLINDLESVQNLYTLQHPPSRRSSKATRRSSRRAFADVNANANGYDSDDSESMYSQASAPASVSAPSLISSKSVKSIYGRQSRTGQGLLPQTSGNAGLGIGVLPPIPQSPFATQSVGARTSGSGEENGSASQRDSLATVRASLATTASTSTSQPTDLNRSADLDDEDEGNPLSNPDKAMYVAKLLQSRQKNTSLQPAAPGTPSRSSSLVSHIERTGSIRPVLALDSVEEQSEAGSTLGRRSQG